MIQKFNLWF